MSKHRRRSRRVTKADLEERVSELEWAIELFLDTPIELSSWKGARPFIKLNDVLKARRMSPRSQEG